MTKEQLKKACTEFKKTFDARFIATDKLFQAFLHPDAFTLEKQSDTSQGYASFTAVKAFAASKKPSANDFIKFFHVCNLALHIWQNNSEHPPLCAEEYITLSSDLSRLYRQFQELYSRKEYRTCHVTLTYPANTDISLHAAHSATSDEVDFYLIRMKLPTGECIDYPLPVSCVFVGQSFQSALPFANGTTVRRSDDKLSWRFTTAEGRGFGYAWRTVPVYPMGNTTYHDSLEFPEKDVFSLSFADRVKLLSIENMKLDEENNAIIFPDTTYLWFPRNSVLTKADGEQIVYPHGCSFSLEELGLEGLTLHYARKDSQVRTGIATIERESYAFVKNDHLISHLKKHPKHWGALHYLFDTLTTLTPRINAICHTLYDIHLRHRIDLNTLHQKTIELHRQLPQGATHVPLKPQTLNSLLTLRQQLSAINEQQLKKHDITLEQLLTSIAEHDTNNPEQAFHDICCYPLVKLAVENKSLLPQFIDTLLLFATFPVEVIYSAPRHWEL